MRQNKVVTAMIAVVLMASMVLSSGSIGISVDNDKLPGSDQAVGINYIGYTTLSTALASTLTPARDLTGEWEGTGVYYWLDMWGERDVKITATCKMSLKQKGNVVTGVFDIYPTKYEDIGEAGYTPPIENHYRVDGIVSGTTLTFDNFADKIGTMGGEQWKFTFTTDKLSGGVTNVDYSSYSGSDSDPYDFILARVSTPKQGTGFKLIDIFSDIFDEFINFFNGMLGVEEDKTSSEWVGYGYSLFKMGDYSGAITAFDRAIDIDQDSVKAWNNKGYTLNKLDRHEEAITAFDQAIGINPDHVSAWNGKGRALYELGRYEEAITAYDGALDIDPDHVSAWNNKGLALGELGRYEEAITAFDRAIAIDPNYKTAWYNKGYALGKLGRYENAITAYDKALNIDPDYAIAWNNKGLALYELGRYEEAITAFDRALAINPDYAKAWNNKGLALYELGRYEEAITAYDRALAIDPDYTDAKKNRDDCLSKLGKTT